METIFVDKIPEVEISGGVVHITSRSGNAECRHTMSIRTLARFETRCHAALERFGRGDELIRIDD